MRRAPLRRETLAGALLSLALLVPSVAGAIDFKINKEALRLDLTESMFVSAHLDDGNHDPTTKNYGELVNRLNAQLAWRKFLFFVRFDTGAWVNRPDAGYHSPYVSPDGSVNCPAAAANNSYCVIQPMDSRIYDENGNKYRFLDAGQTIKRGPLPIGVSAFYLEKIGFSYNGRNVEATLGDFYVNLGRGLVLSIRKLDELGTDSTITGGKLAFRIKEGKSFELSGIALAGFTNTQNFDQARAQFVPDPNDFVSALHVDARLFDKVLVGAHAVFGKPACPINQDCGDHEFGYAYRLRPGFLVDAPRLTKWLGVYFEYARMQDKVLGKDSAGNAMYAAANVYLGRTTWLLEFKGYDHYLPWHAANDPFGNLVYQQPPTLEQLTTQVGNNSDIYAGRARVDVRVNRSLILFWSAEVGRARYSDAINTTLFDVFAGAEARWNDGRSHLFPTVGFRNERTNPNFDVTPAIQPEVEERLYSVTWDATQILGGRFSLETQGLLWFRKKGVESTPGSGDNAWREGNIYLSLKWAPKLIVAAGYEFTTISKEQANQHNFFNGSVTWNITSGTSLAVFVGGNRPGLKCISGVCRDFPAFNGARLELVLRL